MGIILFSFLFIITNDVLSSVLLSSIAFYIMSIYGLLGERNYKKYMILRWIQGILLISLSIGLYFILGIDGIIIGHIISYFSISHVYIKTIFPWKIQFSEIRKRWSFVCHSFGVNLAGNTGLFLDKLIIGPMFGFAILGYYQIGAQFMMFAGLFTSAFFGKYQNQLNPH